MIVKPCFLHLPIGNQHSLENLEEDPNKTKGSSPVATDVEESGVAGSRIDTHYDRMLLIL